MATFDDDREREERELLMCSESCPCLCHFKHGLNSMGQNSVGWGTTGQNSEGHSRVGHWSVGLGCVGHGTAGPGTMGRNGYWNIDHHYCLSFDHQDFMDEVRSKEEDMSKVVKMADNFRNKAHVSKLCYDRIFSVTYFVDLKD